MAPVRRRWGKMGPESQMCLIQILCLCFPVASADHVLVKQPIESLRCLFSPDQQNKNTFSSGTKEELLQLSAARRRYNICCTNIYVWFGGSSSLLILNKIWMFESLKWPTRNKLLISVMWVCVYSKVVHSMTPVLWETSVQTRQTQTWAG